MAKVVIIGAGGVGTVVAHKCAQHPEVFTELVIASRTQSKCDAVIEAIKAANPAAPKMGIGTVSMPTAFPNWWRCFAPTGPNW